ncbi:MAG: CehA/McbA family metallohydrolase [Acidobacteriota bacterium]|nr:CehA/McbA family metallohydrolase [Acidobacteriota bacterium]
MSRLRISLVTTAVLAAAVVTLVTFTLPPRARPEPPAAWSPAHVVVRGAYHIHTRRSDGSGTIDQVAAAAARAGLQFIIITDHGGGTRLDPPSYRSGVLCLDNNEISTNGGHYVALGMHDAPYPLGGDPRDVVADVARLGGFGIVAHPYSVKPQLQWHAWDLPFDGIEWMNADSERRQRGAGQLLAALAHYPFRPAETIASIFTRPVRSLARWDQLTGQRRIVGLAAADAHARIGFGGDPQTDGTLFRLPGYQATFEAFSIHAELGHPLSGQAGPDARVVLAAIEAGHVYSSIEGLAAPAVFQFTGRSGSQTADEGDVLPLDGPVELRAQVNAPSATLVLFSQGRPMARGTGGDVTFHVPAERGTYRVEVWLDDPPGRLPMPWIVSNPIYVGGLPPAPPPPAPLPVTATASLMPASGTTGWRVERDTTSMAVLQRSSDTAAGPGALEMRFTLGGTGKGGQYVAAAHDLGREAAFYDRLAFQATASRPLRASLQLRDAAGRRWERSVYLDTARRTVVVPFTDFRPFDPDQTPAPDLAQVRSLLLVVDTTNARGGLSATIDLSDVRLER